MALEDLELEKRYQALLVKYRDEPAPAYRAADKLFEETFGRKATSPEEVKHYQGRIKKRLQRHRARVGEGGPLSGDAS
jgi:hypothetical protein